MPTSAFFDLLDALAGTPEADRQPLVDAFIAAHDVPYTEGTVASFVFLSDGATEVLLAGDHTEWDSNPIPMARVAGTTLFHASVELPVDARVDYKLIVDGEWQLDPLNPYTCPSGLGDNSELRMPQWQYPSAIDFNPNVPRGAVNGVEVNADDSYPAETLSSTILGNARDVFLYTPPGYSAANTYPLLVVNDGGDYVRLAHMPHVLDNLIGAGEVRPLVVAFVSPVNRSAEYVGGDVEGYVTLVDSELMPFIEARVSVSAELGERAVMGTSYGGYISMRLLHDLPTRFGMFASQSGILLYDGGATLDDLTSADLSFAWIDTGVIGDATSDSEAARDRFTQVGVAHEFLAVNEGHSWGSWRARLDDILRALFPAQ